MDDISRQDRPVMCEDGQGPIGAGRSKRYVCGTYYSNQYGTYKSGGVSCTLSERDYKFSNELVAEKEGRKYVVRRLTPLECCRLQGFPDFWEDGVNGSDAARYRMWGNGMALPNMLYVMEGIKEALDGNK